MNDGIVERWLQLDGWAGRTQQRVELVKDLLKMSRIRAVTRTKLGGRRRWIEPGETALVPKTALTEHPVKDVEKVAF